MLYTRTKKKVTSGKRKKVRKNSKNCVAEVGEEYSMLVLYKKPYNLYTKRVISFVKEKRCRTFASAKTRKSMLKKIQIVLEPRHLNCDDWMEWFLGRERSNVLGLLVQSYGSRFCVADLEDVVQEASVVVWEKLKTTAAKDRTREGMKMFMVRTCRYMLSHEMRHMGDEERMDTWQDEGRWEKVGEMLNRDDEMERIHRRRYEKLMDVWERLSEKDRELLTKYYWEGKSMEDIALEMGLKNDKVAKNYKGRAMKLLKEMMRVMKK